MARVALLSNPRSTGNKALLPRVRSFCAEHKDIFHYEVDDVGQIETALRTIARVRPKVLVINGGDGTVQAALTEIYNGRHFADHPPPVAVLPNGKTNLIAIDLGATGDPIAALERVLTLANTDMAPHIVLRELISLTGGTLAGKPVLGMFLGGAGLADAILYCRHKLYPLGLPNGVAHLLAFIAGVIASGLGRRVSFLPPRPTSMTVSVHKDGRYQGRFAVLMVTTLQRVLLGGHIETSSDSATRGMLKLLVIERRPMAIIRALFAAIRGRLGQAGLSGVHLERSGEIRIEGEKSNLILDGELFESSTLCPIVLRSTAPISFLNLAA